MFLEASRIQRELYWTRSPASNHRHTRRFPGHMTSGTIDKSESESAQLFTKITLRATRESDLQTFFEYQLDPIANRMAAFTAKDPTDRDACMTRWRKNLADPTNINKTIMIGDQIVGTIASYLAPWTPVPHERHVTYWIDRQHWGKGIATAALQQFLSDPQLQERPLYASAATTISAPSACSKNAASPSPGPQKPSPMDAAWKLKRRAWFSPSTPIYGDRGAKDA